ncbi:unnamed protein product [Periconia digitata]|uniref:Uncharacterized protein n=1 Tax=Periconia digitata TaxID=1303443 RepID=A0A9W4UJ54_9PLEO|nr:unnamed protein product [Periconia digitata]
MSGNLNQSLNQSSGITIELRAVPEPERSQIQRIAQRIYGDKTQANAAPANLRAEDIDKIVLDINTQIETINARLKGNAWSEAYNVLVTMRDVVQNFSAAASMRRASQSQYDTAWPGTRWR